MAVLHLYLFYFSVKKMKIKEKMKTNRTKKFPKKNHSKFSLHVIFIASWPSKYQWNS